MLELYITEVILTIILYSNIFLFTVSYILFKYIFISWSNDYLR